MSIFNGPTVGAVLDFINNFIKSIHPFISSDNWSNLTAKCPSDIVNCLTLINPCISPESSFLNNVDVSLYLNGKSL